MKEIEVIVDTNGEVSIDLDGYKGKGCSQVSESLAKSLGVTLKSNKKCEYHQNETKLTEKNRV